METAVLKTLAGFLNTDGGTLIIGVSDDGTPVGIEEDGFPNEDKRSLHLVNLISSRMGPQAMTSMHVHFEDHEECRVMVICYSRSPSPVFTKDGDTERFYIRTGPSTMELPEARPNPTSSSGSGERMGTILPVPAGGGGGAAGGKRGHSFRWACVAWRPHGCDGCFDGN